jgi:protein O-GlcNAc transferase
MVRGAVGAGLLTMAPSKLRSVLEEAVRHHNAGRFEEAEKLYARARAAAPTNFDALHLSGLVAHQQARHADAVNLLRRALKLNPSSAVCEMRLGAALSARGECTPALGHLKAAAARAPEMPEAWLHLGIVQRTLGHSADARLAVERALALRPDYLEALVHLGSLVSATAGFEAAVPILRRVAGLQPGNAAALANLGVALAQSGGREEALLLLDRALQIEPGHALALTGRALILQETYRPSEAVAAYAAVLERNPANHEARSGRLLALHYLDDVDRESLYKAHAEFGAAMPAAAIFSPSNTRDPMRRLRVGFLSPDLRAHSVAYFLEPLLAHLDRSQFEVFLYHDHPRIDAMSEKLRSHAALWRHVVGLPHDAVGAMIRADAPDILVDLAGHTGLNRMPLLARRLAPVQVTYLGYPDTTGLKEMDIRLVDSITDPEGEADRFHAEKLVRFAPTAWCYAPPESAPLPAREPAKEGAVTFGCFNNFAKVSDCALKSWASVLFAVPNARLLLKGLGLEKSEIATRLLGRFSNVGIDPSRVEFMARSATSAEHLGHYGRMDIALDTFPYNGTTTTCEALWMGVPVVTLLGDRHAARVGASLLSAAGHPEWIGRDRDDYIAIAAGLAGDARLRCALRSSLRQDLLRSVLMDYPGQAVRFGAALRTSWKEWCTRETVFSREAPISLNSRPEVPITSRNHDFSALSA